MKHFNKAKEVKRSAREKIDEPREITTPQVTIPQKTVRLNIRYYLAIIVLSVVAISSIPNLFGALVGTRINNLDVHCYNYSDATELNSCMLVKNRTVDVDDDIGIGFFTGTHSTAFENQATSSVSDVFEPSVLYWQEDILQWSQEYGLSPNLIALTMQLESCGMADAESGAGALGLFQVMPFHFKDGENGKDPETNAKRGLAYLQRSQELSNGNLAKTLAGYNGGHGAIETHPAYWSPETLRFVMWGQGIMLDIEKGLDNSPNLQSWLEAGGQDLCREAEQKLALNQ